MRVVLASPPDKSNAETFVKFGVPSVLISWWYMRTQPRERWVEVLRILRDGGVWVMIDSGAHTFFETYSWLDPRGGVHAKSDAATKAMLEERRQKGLPTNPTEALDSMNAYVADFIENMKIVKEQNLAAAIAELDIDPLVGMGPIYEWRKWWEKADLADKLIVTIHPTNATMTRRGVPVPFQSSNGQGQALADAEEMLSGRWGYVGINAGEAQQVYNYIFTRFGRTLRERKIKTHGWGMTTPVAMTKQPWWSVDSSSWSAYGRWGIIYIWDAGRRELLGWKPEGPRSTKQRLRVEFLKRHLERWVSAGMDPTPLLALDAATVDLWNALQWSFLQREKLAWTANAYTLSPDERTQKTLENRAALFDGPALLRASDAVTPDPVRARGRGPDIEGVTWTPPAQADAVTPAPDRARARTLGAEGGSEGETLLVDATALLQAEGVGVETDNEDDGAEAHVEGTMTKDDAADPESPATRGPVLTEVEQEIRVDEVRRPFAPMQIARNPVPEEARKTGSLLPHEESPFRRPVQMVQVGRACDTCVVNEKCPLFKPKASCSLTELVLFDRPSDLKDAMMVLLGAQWERLQFAMAAERMQGGFIDPIVSGEMERFFNLVARVKEMGTPTEEITIRAKGGGAISKLFGKLLGGD